MKRKLQPQAIEASSPEDPPLCFTKKQLRSRLSRRRRLHISPIFRFSAADSHPTEVSEVSCDSSIVSVSNRKQKEFGNDEFRRVITRSYYRKKFNSKSRNCDESLDLSENSCVESCSGADRELKKLKSANAEESEVDGGQIAKSEVSSSSRFQFSSSDVCKAKNNQNSTEITQNEVEFELSGVHQITNSEADDDNLTANDGVSRESVQKAIKISGNKAELEELPIPKLDPLDFDLACSEQFSNGGVLNDGEEEEHNSSSSGIFHIVSDSEFESSDYTPSIWSFASGSQFSEKSIGDESSSPTFELFKEFQQQFCRSTFAIKACDDYSSYEIALLGLENEEDEESYRMMRKRERRQVYVHDFGEEYCNTTDYGDLIIEQRLHMVHWIVEQANNRELQNATMFLGVGLLDRFLSKGYFKNKRNLQIAGIACLALATRIEENQPYNCVRRNTFHVENTTYARCEVVAMEWLVQEVLNFQCFLPTLYNFLWFYFKAARANEKVEKTARNIALLTLMGHQHLYYWPSTVAAALVVLASLAENEDASCHLITAIHAREKDKDLPECIKVLVIVLEFYNIFC
ncbi:hypothetical protein BUALT_Bualt05G0102800 [Buddleja alternifolia]|uniref:Cyclin-like domain-containing protein n=1 Tax=Buddleja alternifolia TaxID=168488 RepID=A0AAV6XQ22_9LAMI|nr:hypothetical protein BUALT_Bualt05G0102800 [Buddleja alternifolia]